MATKIIVPHLGESIESAILTHWYHQVGATVTRGEELADLETDKATLPIECPKNGSLLAILVEPGSEVHIGQLLAVVGEPNESWREEPSVIPAAEVASESPMTVPPEREPNTSPPSRRLKSSPLARRQAQALGIDINLVRPAAGNRVKEADVKNYASQRAQPEVEESKTIEGRNIPISKLKKLVGQRMVSSVQTAPQFSVTVRVDARQMMALREEYAALGKPVSMTSMIVYFAAQAIPEHPLINSRYEGDQIVLFDNCNIGVAVATSDGLRVPVIHRAETLLLTAIDAQLKSIAENARQGKMSPVDVADGTFTISNLGMMGVSQFTPILNPPEAAILGVGAPFTYYVPAEGGDLRLVHMMELTLTADHRVLDGADAAQFLTTLKKNLETCEV
jgi:pyruvate dehydrogenase E2 component (dihydrolipoamide acetyltransferase)